MAQYDIAKIIKADISKSMERFGTLGKFSAFPFDLETLMDAQRKTFQTITESGQAVVENLQEILSYQAETMSHLVEAQTEIAREGMREGTPEDKIAAQAALIKTSYDKMATRMGDLSDMVYENQKDIMSTISTRISANLAAYKTAVVVKNEVTSAPANRNAQKKSAA